MALLTQEYFVEGIIKEAGPQKHIKRDFIFSFGRGDQLC